MEKYKEIVSKFDISEKIERIDPLGAGFINDTLKVFVEGLDEPAYILQRKNHVIFPDVPSMMDNIRKVTGHITAKGAETLVLVYTRDGGLYYRDAEGNFWAMTKFNPGTTNYEKADTPALAYQGGKGLGVFHRQVADFNEPLVEIIKGFHNIRWRFQQWDESLARDAAGRVSSLSEEISWIESRRAQMLAFWEKFEKGELPRRVTHNDTKISNFLFDAKSGDLRCAIDLDTLMSSTLLNDTGDALRSYTNTTVEDDKDLSKVSMSFDMFKAYMEGYLSEMKDFLTASEKENLAFSGLYITYEQVLRFLMDYIDGDTYYRIAYPEHNLVRTRAQYKLLTSMEAQLPEMKELVWRLTSK